MKKIAFVTLAIAFFAAPAHAFTNDTGYYDGLEYVADTAIPGPDSSFMSLCYVTRDFKILGLTLTSDIKGYALADDGCVSEPTRPFSEEQMVTAQSLDFIATDIPTVARNDTKRTLQNYGLWGAIVLALFAVVIRRLKSLMGLNRQGPMRAKASARILSAMCHVGSASGVMASGDIALVVQAARRLTHRDYQTTDVINVADQLDPALTENSFIAFGKGLRDREKDIMMRGVLYVALASGRIMPAEYDFASQLAHGLGIPGEDFRRVMNIALADLDEFPPTL